MKKIFLILLTLILPLQASVAAELSFVHALQGSQGHVFSIEHLVEHVDHTAHHHDDDDDDDAVHEDNSLASTRHLLDYDQGFGINALIPAPVQVSPIFISQGMPMFKPGALVTRAISPLLRPPHAPA